MATAERVKIPMMPKGVEHQSEELDRKSHSPL